MRADGSGIPGAILVRLVVSIVLLTGLAACTGDDGPGSGRTSPSPSPSPGDGASRSGPTGDRLRTPSVSIRPGATPGRIAEPEEACGGDPFTAKKVRPYFPDGPRYTGRGIHPAELVLMHYSEDPYVPSLPQDWRSYQPQTTQLIVCAHVDPGFDDRKVETCRYTDSNDEESTAELRSARYVFRVFEATTARLVDRFSIRGSLNGCPASVAGGVGVSPYYEYVDSKDLAARLRPLVTGPAR